MARPHYRTETIGLRLVNHIARQVTLALVHLEEERLIADGWVAHHLAPGGRASSDTSTTEAAAVAALTFARDAEDIDDAIDGVKYAVDHLEQLTKDALGKRAPLDVARCRDRMVLLRWRPAEWADTDEQCLALPDKAGLCTKHYWQRRRDLEAQGVDTSHDFEPGVSA